jgi:16S rRNA processing protein RimM
MGRRDPGFLAVGFLSKAHGLKGEIVVETLTDHPEGTFVPGVVVRLADSSGRVPDADLPPLRIQAARPFKQGYIVAFGGVESRNEAEALRGRYLLRDVSELEPPSEGEFFYHQLLGLEVFTRDGTALGRIREVYELSPVDILEVRGEGRETMIPFRDEIVVEVDLENGRMVVDPPEGLLDL